MESKKVISLIIGFVALIIVFSVLAITKKNKSVSESSIVKSNTSEQKSTLTSTKISNDLKPWLAAKINWRQFEGETLSVLALKHAGFPALIENLAIFEELTGINVESLSIQENEARQKRQTDFEFGGAIYDVIPIGVTFLGEAQSNNWLVDLNDYIDSSMYTDRRWYAIEEISKPLLGLLSRNNKQLAMPFSASYTVFWYRKDLFRKYKISVPDSYEDIILMKKKLQRALNADGQKDIYAFIARTQIGAGNNTGHVIPCIRTYGGSIFDENWNAVFNSPQAVEAMTVYRQMVTGIGTPPGSKTMDLYQMRDLFTQGKLASMLVENDYFTHINSPEKSPIWDKWDADLPLRGPIARVTPPWSWGLGINSASKHKGAAWLFIQWACSDATVKLLGTGTSPARMAAWEGEAFQKMNVPGLIKSSKWALKNAIPSRIRMGIPEFPNVGHIVSVAFNEIIYGAPVKKTLDDAVKKVDKVMNQGPTKGTLRK